MPVLKTPRLKFKNAPKVTARFGEIPIGRIVNDLIVNGKPGKSYAVLSECSKKTSEGIVSTHILTLSKRFVIAHQKAVVVSDLIYPAEDFVRVLDLKTGTVLDVDVVYEFERPKMNRLVGKMLYSEPKNRSLALLPYPVGRKCLKAFEKFVPIVRAKRLKKVALRGLG